MDKELEKEIKELLAYAEGLSLKGLTVGCQNTARAIHVIYLKHHELKKARAQLPNEENNMGSMDRVQAEQFFDMVKGNLELENLTFSITSAGSICIGNKILIAEKDLQYPWYTKQLILHEISHYLVPEDTTHGTRFHRKYAELVNKFLAG